jgi:glycosyltransferase involved in cell wall biosynthesis
MNQRQRILHLTGRLDGYGGARMLRYVAASQALAGNRVIVAALSAADSVARELRETGVAVQVIGSRWPVDPVALARFSLLRRKSRVDVVHAWDAAALMHAGMSRRHANQRLMATLDELQTRGRWAARIVNTFRNRVDLFIAADQLAETWLLAQGVAARRIELIRPGVPRSAPAIGSRADWLAQLALPADAKVVAVAGPLVRSNNFDEAIWCFELVRVIYDNARLVIFGDGPDRARLELFAERVSDPGCVQFLGYRRDMADLLPHADVYWQLDASPATPWALLEAAAAGMPAVASDTPAHRAAVSPDRTGMLVPMGSRAEVARATDELFANPDRAKRLGAAAAAFVAERWSLDAALASYERLYEKSLSPEGRS